jgi:hypothetical protein
MMMTPPAVAMMVMTHLNYHLPTRGGHQGCKKRECENTNCKLLHDAHANTLFLPSTPTAIQGLYLATMAMVVAVPAMPMVRMPHRNDNLGTRCGNQRNEEHQCNKTKDELLDEHKR